MPSLVPSRADRRALESEIAAISHPPIDEAREAVRYWRHRASRLPWYRWAARREAHLMASRWRERLLRTRLERWHLRALAPVLLPVSRGRADLGRRFVRWLVRPDGLKGRAALVAAVTVLSVCTALVVLAALAAHLAGALV